MGRGTTPVEAALWAASPGATTSIRSVSPSRAHASARRADKMADRCGRSTLPTPTSFPMTCWSSTTPKHFANLRAQEIFSVCAALKARSIPWTTGSAWCRSTASRATRLVFSPFIRCHPTRPSPAKSQRKINEKRKQTPPRRHVAQDHFEKVATVARRLPPPFAARSLEWRTGRCCSTHLPTQRRNCLTIPYRSLSPRRRFSTSSICRRQLAALLVSRH